MSQQFKMKKPTTAQFVEQILSLFFGLLLFSETHASEYCTSDSCIEAEDLSVAQLGADKQLSHKVRIPFVPFPKPPVTEPWVQGHESGIQLQNGNAVSEVDVPNLGDIPTECPELRKPTNVHFMVINLDRSINRRRRMRSAFMELELPMFERVPGVLVTDATVDSMHPKRLSTSLKLADYGCALAHRRAWQRVVDGDHEWVVIIEDDAELVESVNYTDLPAVPTDADLVLFRVHVMFRGWLQIPIHIPECSRERRGMREVVVSVARPHAGHCMPASAWSGRVEIPRAGVTVSSCGGSAGGLDRLAQSCAGHPSVRLLP
eukprot:m.929252 g.929252  ORF g.929252 m.929252 type:complete len:318 (-) comp23781_c0_seq17:625-1578(-)